MAVWLTMRDVSNVAPVISCGTREPKYLIGLFDLLAFWYLIKHDIKNESDFIECVDL